MPSPAKGYTPTGKSKFELLDYIASQGIMKADGNPYAPKTLKGYDETQLLNVIYRHMGRGKR
jgi:hypothetical protein